MDEPFDRFHFGGLIQTKRHDEAIAYVDRFRGNDPTNPELKRFAALARGGKGEHILESSDRLGVAPSLERLEEMIGIFEEAIEIDPTLADPYWDLAVIHGRFRQDATSARQYLAQARELGYQHPMMAALENLIDEQA